MTEQIVITNAVMQNGGDAAITFATLELLKISGIPFHLMAVEDQNPIATRRLYPELPVTGYAYAGYLDILGVIGRRLTQRLFRFINTVRSRALLVRGLRRPHRPTLRSSTRSATISVGGTYIVPRYDYKNKLLNLAGAVRRGEVTILSTQSLGPFERDHLDSRLAKLVLNEVDLILLRDEVSREYLKNLGVDKPMLAVCHDSVFAMASKPRKDTLRSIIGAKIGISVRDCTMFFDNMRGSELYASAIRETCTYFVREYGCKITFISTCQGLSSYQFDDSAVARDIVRSLPLDVLEHVAVDIGFHTPQEFTDNIEKLDALVSTRLHGAIQALNVGTPVIPIVYEFKTKELWREYELDDFCLPLSPERFETWKEVLDRFAAEPNAYDQALRERTFDASMSAKSAANMIADLFAEREHATPLYS